MSTTNFGPHPLTLFTQGTPNGFPISVALEELGLKYNVKPLEFSKNEQKQVRCELKMQGPAGQLAMWRAR